MHFNGLSDMFGENMLFSMKSLVELRKRPIHVVSTAVGMGISWNFSTHLLSFIEKPLTGHTYLTDLKQDITEGFKQRYPVVYRRFVVVPPSPLSDKERKLNYSAPLEPFFVQCKIAMIAGFILALPLVFLQIWLHAAPRLKQGKNRPHTLLRDAGGITGARNQGRSQCLDSGCRNSLYDYLVTLRAHEK